MLPWLIETCDPSLTSRWMRSSSALYIVLVVNAGESNEGRLASGSGSAVSEDRSWGMPPSGVPLHCWCLYGLRLGLCDPYVSVNGSGRCLTAWFAAWLAVSCVVRSLVGYFATASLSEDGYFDRVHQRNNMHTWQLLVDLEFLWSACIL